MYPVPPKTTASGALPSSRGTAVSSGSWPVGAETSSIFARLRAPAGVGLGAAEVRGSELQDPGESLHSTVRRDRREAHARIERDRAAIVQRCDEVQACDAPLSQRFDES